MQDSPFMRVILASGSPRRRELLSGLVTDFVVISSDIDEIFNPELTAVGDQVSELAEQKAKAVARLQTDNCLVLGADTIVYLDQEILGKPRDAADAERMLSALSEKWHEVITGVAIVKKSQGQSESFRGHAVSRVRMNPISVKQIQDYIATGEPMDKAGAYAIQGGAGDFICEIDGSYENIVGLPLELTADLLRQAGAL